MSLLVVGHLAKMGNHPVQENVPMNDHASLPIRHTLVVVMVVVMVVVTVAMGMGLMEVLMTVIRPAGHRGPEPPLWGISIESSAESITKRSIRKRIS